MTTKWAIFCETGFQGSSYHDTRCEAIQAARWRELCTGLGWFATPVLVR